MQNIYRMRFLLAFLILPSYFAGIFAQKTNFVENPSFENFKTAHTSFTNSNHEFNEAIEKWYSPNLATPDLITPEFKTYQVKFTKPHSGKNMVGLRIGGIHHAEYLSIELNKQLEKGKRYHVEFWIGVGKENKRYNSHVVNNNFGIYFGKKLSQNDSKHRSKNKLCISLILKERNILRDKEFVKSEGISYFLISTKVIRGITPQLNTETSQLIIKPGKWFKIEGVYEPKAIVTHICLGQFASSVQKPVLLNGYFLIDDITIHELDSNIIDTKDKLELNTPLVFQNIQFETNKALLLPQSYEELSKLLAYLKKNESLIVEFIGHTDNTGNPSKNLILSQERAKAVYNYFLQNGIMAERLMSKGEGSNYPLKSNKSSEGRKKNRRVEFLLKEKKIGSNQQKGTVYKFPNEIVKKSSTAAWENTFIGEYKQAIIAYERNKLNLNPVLEPEDSVKFSKYKKTDAIEFILKKAKQNSVVFINEAHHVPQHRAFVLTLLQSLYDNGYRYFGLEALNPYDTLLMERKFPVLNSGYYVKEPLMGDLIRQALKIGFKVFAYEPTLDQMKNTKEFLKIQKKSIEDSGDKITLFNPDGTKQTVSLYEMNLDKNTRELAQARNIKKIIDSDPKAKIAVLAGFGHIKESESGGWKPMATYFKKISNIDPLTIDQVKMTPGINKELISPYYKMAGISTPSILLNNDNNSFVIAEINSEKGDEVQFFDIQIYHPQSIYSSETRRPDWLTLNGQRKKYEVKTLISSSELPCMLLAHKAEEEISNAIPMDCIVVKDINHPKALLLPVGKYKVLIKDSKNRISVKNISVE